MQSKIEMQDELANNLLAFVNAIGRLAGELTKGNMTTNLKRIDGANKLVAQMHNACTRYDEATEGIAKIGEKLEAVSDQINLVRNWTDIEQDAEG